MSDNIVPDGTIIVLGIRYDGSVSGKTYDYTASKIAGRWYMTGTGKTPQDASWQAVNRWLAREGRHLVRAEVITSRRQIWPVQVEATDRGWSGMFEAHEIEA